MERYVTSGDTFNDAARFGAITRLRHELSLPSIEVPAANRSVSTIGIEIEMTWRQAFPDLAVTWPEPGSLDRKSTSYQEFSRHFDSREKRLMPTLKHIENVIPRVGVDAYWEFSFLPTKNLSVTGAELAVLYDTGVLNDTHDYSLHMTVAGIDNDRDAFAFLCGIELADGTNLDRLMAAVTSKKGAWARKGVGGIMKRRPSELMGEDSVGYEFRTLSAQSQNQVNSLLDTAANLADLLQDEESWRVYRSSIEHSLKVNGLDLKAWPRPKANSLPWLSYIRMIESMK